MSVLAADEFRLLYAVLLNALVIGASWRFARRFNPADRLAAAGDAGLMAYLVQYLSVCATGLVGAMHPLTIALVALLASTVLAAVGGWSRGSRRGERAQEAIAIRDSRDDSRVIDYASAKDSDLRAWLAARVPRAVVCGAIAFVIAYAAALVWYQRLLPVIANDALTYHLPAAVQWLLDGRISFYEAWFYNPANSYSPLGGSAFLAWLIAPMGNDVVARFAQVGPAVLLLVAMLNLGRAVGANAGAAALIAAACVLARPFMSQTILSKDDLWVAAFFVLLVDALRRERWTDRFGPWRAAVALGLLLATKYTVLFSLPILLLLLPLGRRHDVTPERPTGEGEAPAEPASAAPGQVRLGRSLALPKSLVVSARLVRPWRGTAIAIGLTLLLAGPWYLRNWRLTGNPLYPTSLKLFGATLLPGMLDVHRSDLLATPRGAWDVFVAGYYGTTATIAVVLLFAWAAAWAVAGRRALRDPLLRTCLVGPVIGIGLFVAAAPYGEMRFAYPSVALLFACAALALARLPWGIQIGVGGGLTFLSAATAFRPEQTPAFTAVAAAAGIVAAGVALTPYAARLALAATVAVALGAGLAAYVNWKAYLREVDAVSLLAWSDPGVYGPVGRVWAYARNETPPGATLAYANTYFTYPLMGFRYDHRVVHAPTRAGLERFTDMPRIDAPMTGEQITGHVVAMLRENPDRDAWLRRLRETGAAYLVVMKQDPARPSVTVTPPESIFAAADPDRFVRVFENEAGTVYRINW